MDGLRSVIAKNIAALRMAAGLTQLELGERLSYSDKAVSKWERGESTPDVLTLKQMADIFGVTVDYFLSEHEKAPEPKSAKLRVRLIVTLLSALIPWFAATLLFVMLSPLENSFPEWLLFVYAVPVCSVVFLVFNSVWGKNKKLNYLIISVLCWSFLVSVYLSVLPFYNGWALFFLGIPAQIAIILWSKIKARKNPSAEA